MGLSRGGGAVAFQRIVTRVADLPSPLDAQPGERIIVRETDEVYGLNVNTRMWEVIGTLKKVGGRRPEELGAHLDSKENPHGTNLQQVLDGGSAATAAEVTLRGPKASLRMLGDGSAIRVGPDAGELDGLVWVNAGARSAKQAFLRFLRNNTDQFVVSGDGSVVSSGSASFAGGFKGPAVFEDEITASEGVFGAKSFDLVLGSDKSVVVRVGADPAAHFDSRGALICGSLEVSRDLLIGGGVQSNLTPYGKRTLGVPAARWESAALKTLDLAPDADQPGIVINVAANAKKPVLLVTGSVPGDVVALLTTGQLGLGTDAPERRLDVRGSGLVVGNGKARISIDDALCFNRGVDGRPVDPSMPSWTTSIGADGFFSVTRRDPSGENKAIVTADETMIQLGTDTVVHGGLSIFGALQIAGLSAPGGKSSIFFDRTVTTYSAIAHSFVGTMDIVGSLSVAGDFTVNGALVGAGTIGKKSAPWSSAYVSGALHIGDTVLEDGVIKHAKGLVVESPILSIGSKLHMDGALAEIQVLDVLEIKGSGGSMVVGAGQYLGLTFEGDKPATIYGVGEIILESAPGAKVPAITVNQTWKSGVSVASLVEITDEGSDASSALADYRVNGHRVAAIRKDRMEVAGNLQVGGLGFKKLQEDVRLDGPRAETKFKIPAGVRVEAVIVTILERLADARFVQVGDLSEPDRFAGPSTELAGGSVIRGLNHCDRGLSVQKVAGPVVVAADAPTTGRVRVTVYYVDPVSA